MKNDPSQILDVDSLRWLQLFAALSALLAGAGFLTLTFSSTAHAAPGDPPPGFQGGIRTFNNPFAAPSGGAGGEDGGDDFFNDEGEDEEFDFPAPSQQPSNPGGNTGIRPGFGQPAPRPFGGGGGFNPPGGGAGAGAPGLGNTIVGPNGAVSGGGSGADVTQSREIESLRIDSETGDGSKAMVTDFNFPDADILDIAKTLGKLTGKNFILDKDVKGRISIVTNSPITIGDAWRAFLTALDMNQFALIPSGKYIRIARQRDARDKQIMTYTGDYSPDTDALITRVFPLKYLSADEVARNFRSFMPANSRIIPYDQTNTVIVTDTGSNIAKLQKLLEILDVEGYDAGIEVIPVKWASAVELSKLIDTLIPGTSTVGGTAGGAGGSPRFSGRSFTARRTKEGGIINTILADERTNTLIVHANSRGAEQVRELVNKLDQKQPATVGGGRVNVVYLQFAEAEQIATTLNNLSSSAGSSRFSSSSSMGAGAGGTGVNPVQTSLFEGAIRVSADKATNSLVITASPADFVTVQRVINKLDIPRDQVYAEVVIMEVALNRDFNFSSNVVNPTTGIGLMPNADLLEWATNPLSQKGAVLSWTNGTTTPVTVGGETYTVGGIQGLIKALQTNSNANVLATPQIMTLDNQEATFETAEKIPVLTTTAVQGAVSSSTSKESIALSVTIKPQINKMSNFVKLDIQAKLEDISNRELPAQVQNLAYATVGRTAKTSIVVADHDTVVLGGLMRDNVSETISKVPLLGDIPLLGWLFKAKKSQSVKTNMLIFITPQIVRQYEKVRSILDKKLQERDEFLEANTGGEDPSRKYRNKIIKELPDMDQILSEKPQTVQAIDGGEEGSTEEAKPSPDSTGLPPRETQGSAPNSGAGG